MCSFILKRLIDSQVAVKHSKLSDLTSEWQFYFYTHEAHCFLKWDALPEETFSALKRSILNGQSRFMAKQASFFPLLHKPRVQKAVLYGIHALAIIDMIMVLPYTENPFFHLVCNALFLTCARITWKAALKIF